MNLIVVRSLGGFMPLTILKKRIRAYFEKHNLMKKSSKNDSIVLKPLKISNQQYIVIGKSVKIYENARIECYGTFKEQALNPKLIINNNVIINNNFTALIADECSIGENTIIAHNVSIINENHGIDLAIGVPFHEQVLTTRPITIGKNCWIGCNVVLIPGASLGDNCVVGAGAVVNKTFPSNTMIAGVPAKIIKRYDPNTGTWANYSDGAKK